MDRDIIQEIDREIVLETNENPDKARRSKKTEQPPEPRGYINSGTPNDEQWSSLRSLRLASIELHQRVVLATRMGSDRTPAHLAGALRQIGRECKSAAEFLNTGILTFRDVLHGHVPASLKDILAFICLSYNMYKVLESKGTTTGRADFFQGIPKWRLAIRKQLQREVFDYIVSMLWPEECRSLAMNDSCDATETTPTISDGVATQLEALMKQLDDDQTNTIASIPTEGVDSSHRPESTEAFMNLGPIDPNINLGDADDPYRLPSVSTRDWDPDGIMQSFQQPVDNLLRETGSSNDIRFADFLNISATFPVEPTSEEFIHPFPPRQGFGTQASSVLLPDHSLHNIQRPQSRVHSMHSRQMAFQKEPEPTTTSLLFLLCNTVLFQIALKFLCCK
jgi:hypothetical protein